MENTSIEAIRTTREEIREDQAQERADHLGQVVEMQ